MAFKLPFLAASCALFLGFSCPHSHGGGLDPSVYSFSGITNISAEHGYNVVLDGAVMVVNNPLAKGNINQTATDVSVCIYPYGHYERKAKPFQKPKELKEGKRVWGQYLYSDTETVIPRLNFKLFLYALTTQLHLWEDTRKKELQDLAEQSDKNYRFFLASVVGTTAAILVSLHGNASVYTAYPPLFTMSYFWGKLGQLDNKKQKILSQSMEFYDNLSAIRDRVDDLTERTMAPISLDSARGHRFIQQNLIAAAAMSQELGWREGDGVCPPPQPFILEDALAASFPQHHSN